MSFDLTRDAIEATNRRLSQRAESAPEPSNDLGEGTQPPSAPVPVGSPMPVPVGAHDAEPVGGGAPPAPGELSGAPSQEVVDRAFHDSAAQEFGGLYLGDGRWA